MRTRNDSNDRNTPAVNTAVASGGACVITVAAVADEYHTLDYVGGGYNGVPDADSVLTVAFGGTAKFVVPVTAAGALQIPLPRNGLQGPINSAMTVALVDGSQIKHLALQYREV